MEGGGDSKAAAVFTYHIGFSEWFSHFLFQLTFTKSHLTLVR